MTDEDVTECSNLGITGQCIDNCWTAQCDVLECSIPGESAIEVYNDNDCRQCDECGVCEISTDPCRRFVNAVKFFLPG